MMVKRTERTARGARAAKGGARVSTPAADDAPLPGGGYKPITKERAALLADIIVPDAEPEIVNEKAHAVIELPYGIAYAHFEQGSAPGVEELVSVVAERLYVRSQDFYDRLHEFALLDQEVFSDPAALVN